MADEIIEGIRACIDWHGQKVDDMADLFAAGVLDSLSIVEVIEKLEERFAIAISADDMRREHWQSITAITSLVTRKLGA